MGLVSVECPGIHGHGVQPAAGLGDEALVDTGAIEPGQADPAAAVVGPVEGPGVDRQTGFGKAGAGVDLLAPYATLHSGRAARCCLIHTEACAGSTARLTTSSSSLRTVSTSTASRRRAVKEAMVASAS